MFFNLLLVRNRVAKMKNCTANYAHRPDLYGGGESVVNWILGKPTAADADSLVELSILPDLFDFFLLLFINIQLIQPWCGDS